MRRRILEAIEVVLEEELTEALGTGRYQRGEARRGSARASPERVRLIANDVRRIVEACGVALGTGRPVPMRLNLGRLTDHRGLARTLRATLAFEARNPHRGARGVLRQALRERETRIA